MSDQTIHFPGYDVDVSVTHFRPYIPELRGATPEDSDEGEEYELKFDVIKIVKTGEGSAEDIPTFDNIEEKLVEILH